MGSYASLAVPWHPSDPSVAPPDEAVAEVKAWLTEVESALSPYREDSDLCRWRSGALALGGCSPLLADVVDAVGWLEDLTDGGFHPYDRQGRFDPTGYVKGWAVERSVALLVDAGLDDAFFGVGGDIQMVGRADTGRPWRVAVTDPRDERRILAVVEAPVDGRPFAVATSGASQRGDHIWAGLGGRPGGPGATDALASVTVIGPDLGHVDAFATAIWARATNGPLADAWGWLPERHYGAMAVLASGAIRMTPGMGAHLVRAAA
jgi:thiamine biosynthesis lipoprotein